MDCIDLTPLAGDTYRLTHDESARHEVGGMADPWLLTIPCQYGEIYPHGGDRLGFASKSRGGVAQAVAHLEGATVVQDGDDGLNVTFPARLFPEVCRLVKPRRRRHTVLSPERREALIEQGRANLRKIHGARRQSDSDVLAATIDPKNVLG